MTLSNRKYSFSHFQGCNLIHGLDFHQHSQGQNPLWYWDQYIEAAAQNPVTSPLALRGKSPIHACVIEYSAFLCMNRDDSPRQQGIRVPRRVSG
jgi:hypothetical protein